MNKRIWINIALFGLIILLSVFVLNSNEDKEPKLVRLSSINKDDIVKIKLLRKEMDNLEFNKKNNAWYLTSPKKFSANNTRINTMLRMLETKSYRQLNLDDVSLKKLGLEKPLIIMKLNDSEFKFGITDAIDQHRYVLYEGKIHLINDFLYQQLMTSAAFFAALKLLPENFKINSIAYPKNKIEFIDGQWKAKTLMNINPDQLKRIVFNWENSMALSASKYEPPESEAIIKISSNNKAIQFIIVATEPHLILGRKDLGIQYHLGNDVAKQLLLGETKDNKDKLNSNNDVPLRLLN